MSARNEIGHIGKLSNSKNKLNLWEDEMKVQRLIQAIFENTGKNRFSSSAAHSARAIEQSGGEIKEYLFDEMFVGLGMEIKKNYIEEIETQETDGPFLEGKMTHFMVEVFVFSKKELSQLIENIVNEHTP
jgi:hypothetical protein